jgi:hypothetical protein
VRRLLITASVVPSSPILVTLMKEALSSSETSVLTRATPRNIPEGTVLHSHRREYFKPYTANQILCKGRFELDLHGTKSWKLSVRYPLLCSCGSLLHCSNIIQLIQHYCINVGSVHCYLFRSNRIIVSSGTNSFVETETSIYTHKALTALESRNMITHPDGAWSQD